MDYDHWQRLADRLEAAWSAAGFPEDRRRLYYEVLADLPGDVVAAAVDELIRQDREQMPAPGVIRALALRARPSSGADTAPDRPSVPPATPLGAGSSGRSVFSPRAAEIGAGAGLVLTAIGLLLPWARVFVFEVSGLETPDGKLFGAGILAGAAVLALILLRKIPRKGGSIGLAATGGVVFAGAVVEIVSFERELEGTIAQVGIGLYVFAAGAALWSLGAIALAVLAGPGPSSDAHGRSALDLAAGRPAATPLPTKTASGPIPRSDGAPRRLAFLRTPLARWAALAGGGAAAGIALVGLGAVALTRPAERCARAVAEVDAGGNRIPGAQTCLEAVAVNAPLNAQLAPVLLGVGAMLLVAGAVTLAAMAWPGHLPGDRRKMARGDARGLGRASA